MADKVVEDKPVESTVEDTTDKAEKTEEVAAVEKAENGDAKAENGDADKAEDTEAVEAEDEEEKKNGDEADAAAAPEADDEKCTIKRKSVGGEEVAADGVTPEKKAKLDEAADAEVAA